MLRSSTPARISRSEDKMNIMTKKIAANAAIFLFRRCRPYFALPFPIDRHAKQGNPQIPAHFQRLTAIHNADVRLVSAFFPRILYLPILVFVFFSVVGQPFHEYQSNLILSFDVVGPDHLGLVGAVFGLVNLGLRLLLREGIDTEVDA